MSFFDETRNAGILLLIVALLGIVFAAVAVFAIEGYKDAEMWKKIVYITGAVASSAVLAILGLDIMNGSCRFQIGKLFSDVTSKYGVLVAITAGFGITQIIESIFSIIAFGGLGEVFQIIVGVLFILMAWLLVEGQQDARNVVWIILLILYIIMAIVMFIACFVLVGIPFFLLSICLIVYLVSPEVKQQCGM